MRVGGSATARSAAKGLLPAGGLLDKRLVFVSGKGGVGKTTLAAALGLLASEAGKRVLVCDVEARGDLALAYECGPTRYVPREVAPLLFAMSMDTEASLREYLRINFKIPAAVRVGPVAQAFDFVATAVPGVREILTVGKLCYEVRENHFDLVIVDAPASGNIVGELAAPVSINDLVKFGGVATQTRWMLDILENPAKTGVCLVATPEEMPVNEAIDLASRLGAETGVSLSAVIANRVLPELFGRGEEAVFEALGSNEARSRLAAVLGDPGVADVLDAARVAVRLRRSGAEHLERLRAAIDQGVPLAYLPYLFGRASGARATRQIADALAEELAG